MVLNGSNYCNLIGYRKVGRYGKEDIYDGFYFMGKKYKFKGSKSEIDTKLKQYSDSRKKSISKKEYYKVKVIEKQGNNYYTTNIYNFPKTKTGLVKQKAKYNLLKEKYSKSKIYSVSTSRF